MKALTSPNRSMRTYSMPFARQSTLRLCTVGSDSNAVVTYLSRRLDGTRASGKLETDDVTIDDVAALVRAEHRQFLYARLVIHEILAPKILCVRSS